ncbi:MAG: site-specific recombinase resolvase, partial [Oceanibaculum sp.]
RRGVQRVAADDRHVHDVTLLDGVACAFYWQHLLDSGAMPSGSAIARAEGLHHSVVNELLRLTLLAPDIVEMLLAGRQPRRMSLIWFQRHPLPVDWVAQREIVRRFEEAA